MMNKDEYIKKHQESCVVLAGFPILAKMCGVSLRVIIWCSLFGGLTTCDCEAIAELPSTEIM